MYKLFIHLFFVLQISCWSLAAQAVRYQVSIHESEWRLQSSPFECRLWQPVPHFGDAVFANRAGEEQAFFLAPTRQAMKAGKASLVVKAPIWDESRADVDMGLVRVQNSATPIKLGKNHAYQLLNELYKGMSPEFTRTAFYQPDEKIQLALSSINFRQAYSQYQACLAQLLPVNFEQISRSRIQFKTARHELTAASRTRLEHVLQYVKADPTVSGFYIDGHTDDVGRRLNNLELSQKRAQAVTDYLVANGVDEALITMRYHGERYPVVKNTSAGNRAVNRRVTIRLERDSI